MKKQKHFFSKILPAFIKKRVALWSNGRYALPLGSVSMGDFKKISPIRKNFGLDYGQPVDRYYIEQFLSENSEEIKGRVLEIGDNIFTLKFGGNKVTKSDILHIDKNHAGATIWGDLSSADHIPTGIFDCIILTQTLHLIFDFRAAIRTLNRILKPAGVLLITVPGISQIDETEWGHSWYWSFTQHSAKRLFEEIFPPEKVNISIYGNVFAATAFLHGLVAEELPRKKLDCRDPYYPISIAIRAGKSH